jgi:hypothetical protein
MIERGDSAGFAFKPVAEVGRRTGVAKHFYSDIPTKARIVSTIDFAHATGAEG